MADGPIYDSVFKTMLHKMPKLVIPFINEAFRRRYALDEQIIQFSEEHPSLRGSKIDDSVFRLGEKIYHIECQSTPDQDMVVRMIEYDFSIALEQALYGGYPYRMEFPSSCVLFLRDEPRTPDYLDMEVVLPDERSFDYRTRVVKAQSYSADEIFQKQLLMLLPYYLMRYEDELSEIAGDDLMTEELIAECADLRMRLADMTLSAGDDLLYEEMVELIIRVSDHLLRAHETLREKVRSAMGGEVLELVNDRAKREADEAREQGLEQGRTQTVKELTEQLKELGVDQEVIDRAVSQMLAEQQDEGASHSDA